MTMALVFYISTQCQQKKVFDFFLHMVGELSTYCAILLDILIRGAALVKNSRFTFLTYKDICCNCGIGEQSA